MKPVTLKCPNCGANLECDLDNLQIYCSHCGAKLVMDVDNLGELLVEKEKTKQIKESTYNKFVDQAINERIKKQSNASMIKLYKILGILLVVSLVAVFLFEIIDRIKGWIDYKPGEIQIIDNTCSKKDVDSCKFDFEAMGFTNVNTIPVSNNPGSNDYQENEVISISFDGIEENRYQWIKPDAIIRISYYSPK